MRILVDENIPRMTVDGLRRLGHDVRDVRGTGSMGCDDTELLRLAISEGRTLITTDKGFVRLRGTRHNGILVVRLRQPNRMKIHSRVLNALGQFQASDWPGLIVVMRDTVQSVVRNRDPES